MGISILVMGHFESVLTSYGDCLEKSLRLLGRTMEVVCHCLLSKAESDRPIVILLVSCLNWD